MLNCAPLPLEFIKDIRQPFEICGTEVFVGVSVGIALAPPSGVAPLELVRRSDIALYRAKDGGRNAYRLFSPDMDDTRALPNPAGEPLRLSTAA